MHTRSRQVGVGREHTSWGWHKCWTRHDASSSRLVPTLTGRVVKTRGQIVASWTRGRTSHRPWPCRIRQAKSSAPNAIDQKPIERATFYVWTTSVKTHAFGQIARPLQVFRQNGSI